MEMAGVKFLAVILSVFFLVDSVSSACKKAHCPQQSGKQFSCNLCHTCLDSASRFCFTADNQNCQCITKIPENCDADTAVPGYLKYTFCHLLDDVTIPAPEITHADEHSISIVIPRFFEQPPFDTQKPSFLYLLATFSKNETDCTSIGHIEAFHRNFEKCMFRVRIHMPKIDFTGTENYYYDDRSPLETQFSRDLFGKASNVTFWTEVTIRKAEKITNGTLPFATVLKSHTLDYIL